MTLFYVILGIVLTTTCESFLLPQAPRMQARMKAMTRERQAGQVLLGKRQKQARVLSRTVPITPRWKITVWEWEKPSAVVQTYWAAEQHGLALTTSGGVLPATIPKNVNRVLDPFGLVTWPGSVVAAQEMLEYRHLVQDRHVLILGAGVGIEAQAAAVLGAKSVMATDVHPTTLELLSHGVKESGLEQVISTKIFDIASVEDLPCCDLMVVADVLYSEELASQVAWRCCEARKMEAKVLVTDSQKFVDFEADLNLKLANMGHKPCKWAPRWLERFRGSGVMVDDDITYDVQGRVMWLGLDDD